jgi:hypothetical protein
MERVSVFWPSLLISGNTIVTLPSESTAIFANKTWTSLKTLGQNEEVTGRRENHKAISARWT